MRHPKGSASQGEDGSRAGGIGAFASNTTVHCLDNAYSIVKQVTSMNCPKGVGELSAPRKQRRAHVGEMHKTRRVPRY